MDYHPVVQKIKQLIHDANVPYETFEHEAVRTSEEASKIRPGYGLHQGTKAMIMRIKKRTSPPSFAMFCLPADMRMDNRSIKDALDLVDIRFATPDEIDVLTHGVQIGGVPPFGNIFGIPVYADPHIFENEKIVFNAGDRRYSIAMSASAYRMIVQPIVQPIAV